MFPSRYAHLHLSVCSNYASSTSFSILVLILFQLKQKSEQLNLSEMALHDKRAEQLQTETKLCQVEEKYYSSNATIADKINQDLRVRGILSSISVTMVLL